VSAGVWLAVMLGGALGSAARLGVAILLRGTMGVFPVGTLAVNVVGGLAMGFIVAWVQQRPGMPELVRVGITTGFLGGFTTFSTFSIETLMLWREGQAALSIVNLGANALLSVGACLLGFWLARVLFG
jgi:CrcB protein